LYALKEDDATTLVGYSVYALLALLNASCISPHTCIPGAWLPLSLGAMYPPSATLSALQLTSVACTGYNVAHYVIRFIVTFACVVLVNATCDALRELSIVRDVGMRQHRHRGADPARQNPRRLVQVLAESGIVNWYRRMITLEYRSFFFFFHCRPAYL
jgi:hypothetical protein